MKKRKELNALIGLGGGNGDRGSGTGGGGRLKKKHPRKGSASGHRLLRTESAESLTSSSSDPDYGDRFGLPSSRARFPKGDYLRCCKLCCPLCTFVILAACVVACVGLVWMQVALKEDLDGLKERFRTMESNQKTSFQEIPRMTEDLLNKEKELEKIKNGDLGINKIWINITEISKQISLLMLAVNHLKENIKSASDLINLPVIVEELQKSVATIGSTVTSVHHDVEAMQAAIEEQKKTLETLQKEIDNQYLHISIEEMNSTLMLHQKLNDLKFFNLDSTVTNLSWKITSLENHMFVVNKSESKKNLTFGMVSNLTTSVNMNSKSRNETTAEKIENMEKIENGESQVSKLREKLQLINALSSKSDSERSEALKVENSQSITSEPAKLPRISSRSLGNNVERSRHPRSLSLPGISSIEDLQNLFRTSSQGTNDKLSYQDLENLVGSTGHDPQSFPEFDEDGDGRYSISELKVALGL
ncbi:PREDICTED: EF-hand calcium-binding domain-containing protein 14 isoform X1 [Thamnophis sirtalis]|uniref:EF-hand calcium-binding domain-containing protein 14 isoform X1 n=1 Tax=Thamnophis sirtalis TaxID=35019 RepID=A0A6I9Z3Y0_9SAUR|nr:PREDICTED: EF-hand calcium-binding domain-containing protein 14 isoform X1 [Thamnophis sirtalis]